MPKLNPIQSLKLGLQLAKFNDSNVLLCMTDLLNTLEIELEKTYGVDFEDADSAVMDVASELNMLIHASLIGNKDDEEIEADEPVSVKADKHGDIPRIGIKDDDSN